MGGFFLWRSKASHTHLRSPNIIKRQVFIFCFNKGIGDSLERVWERDNEKGGAALWKGEGQWRDIPASTTALVWLEFPEAMLVRAHVTSNWSLESEEELSSCTSLGTTPLLHTQRSKKWSQLQELQYKKYGKAKKSLDLLFDFHALLTPHKLHGWRSYQLVIAAKGQCVKIAYDSSGVRLHDFQLHSVLHFSIKTSLFFFIR